MDQQQFKIIVLISARQEWQAVVASYKPAIQEESPFGEWFSTQVTVPAPGAPQLIPVLFLHGGWGKVAAAASTQYAIDRWQPELLVNLGTCGGFSGEIERGEIVLAERTLIYDIIEQIGSADAALAHFSSEMDLSWLRGDLPTPVHRTLLVSADRDLVVEEIPRLKEDFHAIAGDWESGAIAWVARRNGLPVLILRGVSDLVGPDGGEAYGDLDFFTRETSRVMRTLVDALPLWLARFTNC
jgi:adenosylhomocysteine nucleosidase